MATAELKTKLTADTSQFDAGMIRARQSIVSFASGQVRQVAGMLGGAFAAGAIINFAKNTMAAADDLQDFAKALGVGVEELQALQLTAERAGIGADTLTAALRRIRKAQDDAIAGDGKTQKAFKDLGMSFKDIETMSPDRMFERIASSLNDNNATSSEGAAAGDILGRSYQNLAGVMQDVAVKGLDPMVESLRAANQIMTEESVAAAAAMQAQYETMAKSITVSIQNAMVAIVKSIKTTAAFMGALVGGASLNEAANIAADTVAAELSGPDTTRKNRAKVVPAKRPSKPLDFSGINVDTPTAADRLAKIGGIIGGQTTKDIGVWQRQLKEQEMIRRATEKMAAAAEQTAQNTAALAED